VVHGQVATRVPHFVLAAGELSGDNLGAALIASLRQRWPNARFSGIAGPAMREAGCEVCYETSELSVMGLAEVIRHLPRLRRVMKGLTAHVLSEQPDAFIGIDAPDFNLRLAARVRPRGIRTIQYVAPTVWAWRERRVKVLEKTCDLVLCLLPFEEAFLGERGVCARFVGHPLADEIGPAADRSEARDRLGLTGDPVVALLPGSRMSEVDRLGPVFAAVASCLSERHRNIAFVVPAATDSIAQKLRSIFAVQLAAGNTQIVSGNARLAMAGADVSLVASGTATLECALVGCPMVMAYRTSPVTAAVVRSLGMLKIGRFALPNILANKSVVEEFLQEMAQPEAISNALDKLLNSDQARADMQASFAEIATGLRCGSADSAALAIAEFLDAQAH
jgi:lipid-A-disaccharide synthase